VLLLVRRVFPGRTPPPGVYSAGADTLTAVVGTNQSENAARTNVQLAQRAYAALRAGDLDEVLHIFHPQVEMHSYLLEMEGPFHGHKGVLRWWSGLHDAFPDLKMSLVEVRDLGADRVLIHGRAEGEGAASGVGVAGDYWQAAEARDGLVVWFAAFRTEAEALEAVKLRGSVSS
jgi:ketosteroid isomerase-like protein